MTGQVAPLPGEQPWVPSPVDADLRWPRRQIFGGVATWTPHRGVHRPCDICIEVVHEQGIAAAPRPAPATMKRVGPQGPKLPTFWCYRHGSTMKSKDQEIRRRVEAMRATVEHQSARRR